MQKFIIVFSIFLAISYNSFSQKDTVVTEKNIDDTVSVQYDFLSKTKKKNPGRAALYSAVLPGLGQAYNESYWKMPIVYTVLGGLFFLSDYNNKQYHRFLNAYVAEVDTLTSTVSEFGGEYNQEELKQNKERFRRDRDLNYIFLFAAYGLTIIEANVDANLSDFDVNDDLSIKIYPSFMRTAFGKNVPGICLGFRF